MRTVTVSLSQRSYPIIIGTGLLDQPALAAQHILGKTVVLITNATVGPLYSERLSSVLNAKGFKVEVIVLPDGEAYKNAETLASIYAAMAERRCDRSTTIFALGGGVVGDLAGYAAATYQRGIPFVQIPTTLLSQVDSSVGGKTGINLPQGKNLVGAFWQPKLVLADTEVLKTLPPRELSAGLAEVIKYGLIRDLPFLEWIEGNIDALRALDPEALAYAIEQSCLNKAEVVSGDERETLRDGGRALLNLGHTFGHAIENGLGYGTWLHGEAVGAGMMMSAELSHRLGWLSRVDVERVRSLLVRAGLPTNPPPLNGAEHYMDLMSRDKKVIDGAMRLILLKQLGNAVVQEATPNVKIVAAIEACCNG